MPSVGRPLKLAGAAGLGFAVVVTATGWLYLFGNGSVAGPGLRDALPLDELARHDRSSLPAFIATWAVAGLLLGALARLLHAERLVAAVLLAAATGGWLYAATGVSLFVVRQVPADAAFASAQRVPAIYVAAGLAGLGGALLGHARVAGRRAAPMILAVFTAASGILDVASALTPGLEHRLELFQAMTPALVPRLASALVVPAGIGLIVLARGLWRQKRRAWQIAVVVVGTAAILHLLKALEYEGAIASFLVGLGLVARRHDFDCPGDPTTRLPILRRALLSTAGVFAYGAVALWINRVSADRPITLAFALRETAESLAGMHLRGSGHLAGDFGQWFPLSVLSLGVTAALWLLWQWLAPWRYRLRAEAENRARARDLVRTHGRDTLAPFTLRHDKSYFFGSDGDTFLAYRVVAGVAVVSGDPVGPSAGIGSLVREFIAYAHARDWRLAILGAGERYLGVYRACGLHAVYHGEEAVVETRAFSLEGRGIRKVRQSVHRLERKGFHVEIRYAGDLGAPQREELEQVAVLWRGGAPQRGFTMEFDGLFDVDGGDALFVIGRDAEDEAAGFLHFAVVPGTRTLSLSSMPRRLETPNGFNEWLVVSAIAWARAHGFERLSMNFAPFASILAPEADLSNGKRTVRRVLLAMKRADFQLDNLLNFNRKFLPTWTQRFVVFERIADLPRVGIAGLAAEGYLPLQGIRA